MSDHARGTFSVTLTPKDSGLPSAGRFAREKTHAGDAVDTGAGIMLTIGERSGSLGLQQLATMSGGDQSITYLVTPGSGTGGFVGISGRLELDIRNGQHHDYLVHDLPDA